MKHIETKKEPPKRLQKKSRGGGKFISTPAPKRRLPIVLGAPLMLPSGANNALHPTCRRLLIASGLVTIAIGIHPTNYSPQVFQSSRATNAFKALRLKTNLYDHHLYFLRIGRVATG